VAKSETGIIARIFDWPPVWLLVSLVSVWSLGQLLPLPLFGALGRGLGVSLAGAGLALMGFAVLEMQRARTTVIPHRVPAALVTRGVFRFTRNPIYLGDLLVLLAAVFYLDAIAGIVLVPVFVKIIENRFILAEETRMQAAFGETYTKWTTKVRRWV